MKKACCDKGRHLGAEEQDAETRRGNCGHGLQSVLCSFRLVYHVFEKKKYCQCTVSLSYEQASAYVSPLMTDKCSS
jgi:hypothetical protein